MVILFVLLGILVGGLYGSFWGALIGGVAGYAIAKLRESSKADRRASSPDEDRQVGPRQVTPVGSPALVRALEQRVLTLERQVASLQASVDSLTHTPSSEAADPVPITTALSAHTLDQAVEQDKASVLFDEGSAALAVATPPVDMEEFAKPVKEEGLALASPVDTASVPMPALPAQEVAPEVAKSELDWPDAGMHQPSAPPIQATERAPTSVREFKDFIPARLHPLIFGGNTIVKVGVLILFLGLSFLLKYVAEQVTVPIEMRYASVALLGAGLLALGWRLRDKRDASGARGYGLILQGAGVGVFYLTTLAAMKLHPLLPVSLGFGFMVLITVFTAVLAVAQNAPWLAMVASTAGFATPVLVSTGHASHVALFSYLAILDLGIVGMAWFRAWRPLNLIGFVGTFTLAGVWASAHYTPEVYASVQGFLLLFFLMFTAIGVLFARRALALGDAEDARASMGERATFALRKVGRVDSTLVFGVPLAAYGLQYQMVRDDPWLPALSALVLGLFYVLLGGALWRGKEARYALLAEAYVVVGVLFGTLSVPLALEGVWTGATWAVEAAGMYWLGTRQFRTYTRAFAMALMSGAALRTLSSLGWHDASDVPLLTGSLLGMGMLAFSALSMGLVQRRAQGTPDGIDYAAWERGAGAAAWYVTVATVALVPWMLLMPLWASVCMALMALSGMWLGERVSLVELKLSAPVLHIVAVFGFASTLHQRDGEAMLANGLQGLAAAVLIGLSMLGSAWLGLRDVWGRASSPDAREEAAPQWPVGSSVGIVVGLGLISGSLLFMMPLAHAALIWPVLGLALLWAGIRLAHPALSLVWATLTMASALSFMVLGPDVWPALDAVPSNMSWHGPMGGLAWWTPLLLMLCSVVAGAWLNTAAQRTKGWRMPWVSNGAVHLFMLVATIWWWSQTLPPEILRFLQTRGLSNWTSAYLNLWVTLSSALMLMLASRLNWTLMGQAAGLTIPMWLATAAMGPMAQGQAPLSDLGWLAWPVALLWHPVALRQSARWWPRAPQSWMHVGGFWLFAFLAFRQVQWSVDQWTAVGSAWQALGWLCVPFALLTALSTPQCQSRWPLRDFEVPYRVVGAAPLVIALVGWLCWSLGNAGQASPLPYVPLLNPLELGQGLTLLTLLMWTRTLPDGSGIQLPARRVRVGALGGLGFLLLTAMVLRTCHHWAGVPWQEDALFASRLTQAALSVTWALLGVGLMILGHRRAKRIVWGLGAGLLGVVVAKLFFIELADHGSLYRIVSFIVVGLLLLVVGYFAPVPPSDEGGLADGASKEAA